MLSLIVMCLAVGVFMFTFLWLSFAHEQEPSRPVKDVGADGESQRREPSKSVNESSSRSYPQWKRSASYGHMNPQQRLEEYDRHNPGDRQSVDPQRRLYGRCGCPNCATTRKEWQRVTTALDKPGRIGGGSMASVNLCDRHGCKSMVQGIALGYIALRISSAPGAELIEKEVCPGCVADIIWLMENEPITTRQGAYREPYERPRADDPMDSATSEQLAAALLEKLMKGNRVLEGPPRTDNDE